MVVSIDVVVEATAQTDAAAVVVEKAAETNAVVVEKAMRETTATMEPTSLATQLANISCN